MSSVPDRGSPPAASLAEAAVVVALCFGLTLLRTVAGGARGFSDLALLQTVLVECTLGALALRFLHRRGHDLRELLPAPSWRGTAVGVGLCAAALAAWWLASAWLPAGSLSAASAAATTVVVARPTLPVLALTAIVNGVYEETFLVGYLLRGASLLGPSLAMGISLLVRLVYHAPQGPAMAVAALVFGAVAGAFWWRTRSLWPVVLAHALQDVISLAPYLG
jgi:membrane protease YdiL (CAAX protease family)